MIPPDALSLDEISHQLEEYLEDPVHDGPLFQFRSPNRTETGGGLMPIRMEVYLAPTFVDQIRRKKRAMKRDPRQLLKALRNTGRGYLSHNRFSTGGKDGVFDLDVDRYHTDLTREFRKITSDPENMSHLAALYPFLEDPLPVRVVAHPHGIRVRPGGLLTTETMEDHVLQRLVLIALGVERK